MFSAALLEEAAVSPEAAVEKALLNPSCIHVHPLLSIPQVQNLASTNPRLFETLKVFAYGTVADFPQEIPLNEDSLNKLRLLSLVTYGTQQRELKYADLMHNLRIDSARALESLVIEAVYNDLIIAKLDSKRQIVEIDNWTPRAVAPDCLNSMISVLDDWLTKAALVQEDTVQQCIAEDGKLESMKDRAQKVEEQLEAARKLLEEDMGRESQTEPGPKAGKRRMGPGSRGRGNK